MHRDNSPTIPVDELANELYRAERECRPIRPLTEQHPGLSLADAYRVQQINVDRRLARGERIIGHKIGLTARAMQIKFGVDEPDYGHLLDTMWLDGRAPLDMGELIDPQIEVEPAFVLGADLAGPAVTIDDVLAATDYISVCFEVIDSRIVDWRIMLQDTVADNGSSARVVLGSERMRPKDLRLEDMKTELEVDGRVVETGNTGAILDHPANGVVWLANAVAQFGVRLKAGHVILPGTCTRSYRINGHREAKGRISGLGEVCLTLAGQPYARTTDN
ncbi:MAG: 2-keto-4-pentenoate hydratase [Lysobacterales bacterium]